MGLPTRSSRMIAGFLMVLTTLVLLNRQPLTAVLAASPSEQLSLRTLAAPAASVAIDSPSPRIGADFDLHVTFSNTGPDTGYGPFVDLILPANGADGANGSSLPLDGVTFNSASYLGAPINAGDVTVLTFPNAGAGTGCVSHPLMVNATGAHVQVCGNAGDQLITIRLPFGSFVPSQPAVRLTVNAHLSNLADVGAALTVQARGGYQFGATALNDFCCGDDPSTTFSSFVSGTVTPTLLTVTKTYSGPESETATGPNFPRSYTVSADVAAGQTITDFELVDALPDNVVYQGGLSCTPAGYSVISEPNTDQAYNSPASILRVRWPSYTRGASDPQASCTFNFYVPRLDADDVTVIDPAAGDEALSCNQAQGGGLWAPADARDAQTSFYNPAAMETACTNPEYTLHAKSLAVQKTVSNISDSENSPGDILRYTLQVQSSDYFGFENLNLADVISDGQHLLLDVSHLPQLQVNGNGFTVASSTIPAGDYQVVCYYTGAVANGTTECTVTGAPDSMEPTQFGTTQWLVDLSGALSSLNAASQGRMIGGCIDPANGSNPPDCLSQNDGGTTATITFYTQVQNSFTDNYPSGEAAVDQGDILNNQVTASGDVLDITQATFPVVSTGQADGSSASLVIKMGGLTKSIYAVDGNTSFSSPVKVYPGNTVTYRLTYTLPTSDFENLHLDDYLPLPVFLVGTTADWQMNSAVDSAVPTVGHAKFGPLDTFHAYSGLMPTLTVNTGANELSFEYGDYSNPAHTGTTIDLLFTLTVSSQPFADNLYLTNQAHALEGTTNASDQVADAIIQIQLGEPVLTTTKAAIWTDSSSAVFSPATTGPVAFLAPAQDPRWSGTINSTNLAAAPIDSNLSGVDGGDIVTFALIVHNTGSSLKGAFDVVLQDDMPAGYQIPTGGLNLHVNYGDGGAISYTDLGGGIFGSGIQLVDPSPDQGVCQKHDPTLGNDIILVTYDLQLSAAIQPSSVLVNTGTLANYSGTDGGPNYANPAPTDTATVTTSSPAIAKSLSGTSEPSTTGSNLAIGETVTYDLLLTFTEGLTPADTVHDGLPAGLAVVNSPQVITSAAASGGLLAADFNGTIGNQVITTVPGDGGSVQFDFTNVTVPSDNVTTNNAILLRFQAQVTDTAVNQAGHTLSNSATNQVGTGTPVTSNTVDVSVVEPSITFTKTIVSLPSPVEAGGTVQYRLYYVNATGASSSTAFDVQLTDSLPVQMSLSLGSVTITPTAGVTAAQNLSSGNSVNVTVGSVPPGESVTVDYTATIQGSVIPGTTVTNTGIATWTSLPGSVTGERTGAGGVDDYRATSTRTVTIAQFAATKSIVQTSEAHTTTVSGVERVTIGEIVRYHLVASFPQASAGHLTILDRLPTGLSFINDGTSRVAFVANGGGITSDTILTSLTDCSGLNISGSGSTVTPTCPLPDTAVSSSSSSNADTYNDGTDVYFKLGSLVNGDLDADSEYVVIEFNALVDNVASNGTGTNLANTFDITFDSGTTVSSPAVSVRTQEPAITLTKTIVTPPVPTDAGDSVHYRLTYTNANGANNTTAFSAHFTDPLPTTDVIYNSYSVTNNGSCATGVVDSFAGNTVDVTVDVMPVSCSITVDIFTTIQDTVTPGKVITNTGTVTWTSLPGSGTTGNPTGSVAGTAGSSTGERTGSGGVNKYTTSTPHNLTITSATLVKSIFATSETSTNGTTVAIGEVITYDLLLTLPEGTTTADTVVDALPSGLAIVPGSPQVITATAGSGGKLAADFGGAIGTQGITTNTSDGGSVTFNFNNITVASDNVISNNAILMRFQAQVTDTAVNQAARVISNSATNQVGAGSQVPSNTVTATVVEPAITFGKTIVSLPTPVDAGGTVQYRLSYANGTGANVSTAFDVHLVDAVPAKLALSSTPTITLSGGAAGVTDATSGNTVDVTITSVPPGGSVTIDYSAVIQTSATPAEIITNTSTATWTSLPGAVSGERTGAGGVDDYFATSSQNVTIASAGIVKSISASSETFTSGTNVAVGEVVTYDLLLGFPEGNTPADTVNDVLPSGLAVVPGSAQVLLSGSPLVEAFNGTIGTQTITTVPGNGGSVRFDFTSVSLAGDNDTSNNGLLLRFQATVLDVQVNQAGHTLTNVATNQVGTGTPVSSNSVTVTVVEPRIVTTKSVTPTNGVQSGNPIGYTVTFNNAGTSAAFGVTAHDVLAQGVAYTAGTLSCLNGSTPVNSSVTDNTTSLDLGPWDLLTGETVTCTYQVATQAGLYIDGIHTNTIDADWYGLQGTGKPEERFYNDDGSKNYSMDGAQDTASAAFTVGSPTLVKSRGPNATRTIGDTIPYTLTITSPTGTIRSLTVQDVLPAGVIYQNDAAISGISTTPSLTVSSPNDGTAPVTLTWTFNDAVVTSSPATITYTGRVADVVGNADATTLTNTARLDRHNAADDAQPTLTATASVQLVEPLLTLSKQFNPSILLTGDTTTVTLTVQNTGTSPAYNVVLDDPLPVADYSDVTAVTTPTGFTYSLVPNGAANIARYTASAGIRIDPTETVVFTFTVRVNIPQLTQNSLTNTATVTNYATLPSGGRTEPQVSASADLSLGTDIAIVKTNAPDPVLAGTDLTYTLTVTNNGPANSGAVSFTDPLPSGVTYSSFSGAGWSCSATANTVHCTSPALPVGDSSTVTLTTQVDTAVPDGTTLTNTATLDTNPDDSNPENNTSTSTTHVQALADLAIVKSVSVDPASSGQTFTYDLAITNNGPSDAQGVAVNDPLPSGVMFVSANGTGWTCANTANTVDCTRPSLANGASSTITVQVRVDDSFAGELENTGTVSSTTTDSNPDNNTSTVISTVNPIPILTATKVDSLIDQDGDGLAGPGDIIEYAITISNRGAGDAQNVVFADTPGAHTSLVAGSVTASNGGTIVLGNTPGDAQVEVDYQMICSLECRVDITFQVTIESPLDPAITQVSNQGIVSGENFPSLQTDDTDTVPPDDETVTPVFTPQVTATKTSALTGDANQNGVINPGDSLTYTILVTNGGQVTAKDLVLDDTTDPNTSLTVGTVTSTQGAVITGNQAGDTSIRVDLGTLTPGASATVTLVVRIHDAPLPDGVTTVSNQAIITGSNTPEDISDNPQTPLPRDPTTDTIDNPTAVTLIYFRAQVQADGHTVRITWATGTEIDNYGFNVYRAASNDFSQASLVAFVPSQLTTGQSGGASYQVTDTPDDGATWYYWLEDVDTYGVKVLHSQDGTLAVQSRDQKIFIPLMTK